MRRRNFEVAVGAGASSSCRNVPKADDGTLAKRPDVPEHVRFQCSASIAKSCERESDDH